MIGMVEMLVDAAEYRRCIHTALTPSLVRRSTFRPSSRSASGSTRTRGWCRKSDGLLLHADAKVIVSSAEIRLMNKEQAKAVLDSATAAAEAVVRARGDKITEDEADALFDRVFYGLLVDLVGGSRFCCEDDQRGQICPRLA